MAEVHQQPTPAEPVQIDPSTLNPLSPEVIAKQATINIGRCLGLKGPGRVGEEREGQREGGRWRKDGKDEKQGGK